MRAVRSAAALAAVLALLLVVPVAAQAPRLEPLARVNVDEDDPATGKFEIVGHNPLFNRGMNSALAMHGDYAYVGSRTDGKLDNANRAGVLVVNVADPTNPTVVKEIGPPLEGNVGESSRELRVWKSQEILIVLHTNCSYLIHGCQVPSSNNMRFYDISGEHAADPKLILEFARDTHEFFLWVDPFDPDYALLYAAGAGSQMQVYDLSPVIEGKEPVTLFNGSHGYPSGGLHSLSVSNDGTRAFFALLTGGFAVADVSDFAERAAKPQVRRVTLTSARPTWPGPGAHSAIKLWGRDWVYAADEVYGEALRALGHGCPWGWGRMIDIADPTRPVVKAEYKLPENDRNFCTTDVPRPSSSYSAHNPTQTPNIVFSSWHSGGVQAIGVEDPVNPVQLAELRPDPLLYVLQEDPVLSAGQDKVVMWSFPIVKDGLIYIVDLRNGLYVLRYTGPFDDEVEDTSFLEGNSNQGDALCFEPVRNPKATEGDPELFAPEHCEESAD